MTDLDTALGNFRAELMKQAQAIADDAYEGGELDQTTMPVLAFAIGIIIGRAQNDDNFKMEGLDIAVKMIITAMWANKPDSFKIPKLHWEWEQ
jgi:hypothetical protein